MPKHQVIRDVGHSLLGVLRAEMSGARSKGKAYLAAPTAEFLRKNQPCLLLFLYDLRPSIRVAHEEKWELEEEIVDERGEAHIVKYGRPLDLRLRYLLTAAADDLGDEHELLGLGMKAFLDRPKISGEHLAGDSFGKGDALTVYHDTDFTLATCTAVLGGATSTSSIHSVHPPEASAPRSWGWRRSHRESWLRPERSDAPWLEAKKRSSCGHRERQDNPREAASLVRTPTTER